MALKHGLGRGLGSLINDAPEAPPAPQAVRSEGGSLMAAIGQIRKSPLQPRQKFAPEAIEDLVRSIREHGIIQPLIVRRVGEAFELVAGERRLMAARQVGLQSVPVVVRELADKEALEIALVENLQREDLNPIEEAEGYRQLADKHAMTQEDIARRVGKARATVTNAIRLLDLSPEVKQLLVDGRLNVGHGKVLLGIAGGDDQALLARRSVEEGWSVRDLEKNLKLLSRVPRKKRAARSAVSDAHLLFVTEQLQRRFGTSVRIFPCRALANGRTVKGSVEIDFFSNDDLNRILDLLGVTESP